MAPWLPKNIWSQFCSPKLESMQSSRMRGGNLSSEVHSLDFVLAFLTILHCLWIFCPWVILPMYSKSFWHSSIKLSSSCLKHKPQGKIVPACCMDILFSCSTAPGKHHATSAGCPVQRLLWRDSVGISSSHTAHLIHSLKLTAKAPENRPGPERKRSYSNSNHPFSGVNSLLVSGRLLSTNSLHIWKTHQWTPLGFSPCFPLTGSPGKLGSNLTCLAGIPIALGIGF